MHGRLPWLSRHTGLWQRQCSADVESKKSVENLPFTGQALLGDAWISTATAAMPPKEDMQVEAHIDNALRRHTFLPLEGLLQKDSSSQKCSKEFLLKIDKLICRELQKNKVKNVSLVLNVIFKYANYMTTDGEEWLTTVIKQGIVEKMVAWFEKIRDLLMHAGNVKNEALLTLSEDYFDVVMVVHDHNSDGQIQVLEHFISRTCSLVSDTNVNTFIKQEAVRKVNLLLDTVPREARKNLIFTKEMMSTMSSMGKRILDAGDYDLQVAITEALCRMTSEAQRGELASNWFPMDFITDAFKKIKDSDFETDCRKFLNLVNGMLGEKRRVFTYPCLSAYLDNHKLRIPSDEKLEEFWIDFNVGTQSISFYVSTDNNSEDHQWETVCLTTSEVDMYNIEAIGNERLLTVNLNTPVIVGQKRGTQIRIYFDSALDISDVARKVFSTDKFKDFTKKQSVSVAKTAVHIVFDESGSQIVIPESQGSIRSSKNVTVVSASDVSKKTQIPLSTPCHNLQTSHENNGQSHAKLVTPSRNKVSEASMNITITGGFKAATLEKARKKTPLIIVNSAEKNTFVVPNKKEGTNCTKQTSFQKQIHTAADLGNVQSEADIGSIPKGDEQTEIVPDTQFTYVKNSPLLACLTERYLGLNKKYSDSTCQYERISIPSEFICNKEKGASDILVKQQACHAVFEDEKCLQNTKTTVSSNQKTKLQPQETKTNKKIGLSTQAKEKNIERHERNICSKIDTSLNTSSQTSKIHLHPDISATKSKPDCGWKGTGNVIKSKNSRDAAKQKNAEKEMNEKAKGLPDAARSLISKIGSKYFKEALKRKQEHTSVSYNNLMQILNKNNSQSKKEKGQSQTFKPKGNKESNMGKGDEPWDDVYSFHSLGCDDPTIELGVSSLVLSEQIGSNTKSKAEKLSEKKPKNKIENEQKIKDTFTHLFSNTDNDRGGDDSKTDISWLQDPASKRKLNTFSYSRHRHVKQPEKTLPCKAKDIIKQRKKEKAKQCKESCDVNVDTEDAKDSAKQIKLKRPQRAAVKRKNYREHSDSESGEEPTPASRKEACKYQDELQTVMKPLCIEMQKKPKNPNSKKHLNKPSKTEDKSVACKMTKPVYKKIAVSPVCLSPDSIEQIRAEHSDTELPSRHETVTPCSPSLSTSPPQATPEKFLNISASMKNISTHWAQCSDRSTHKTGKEHDVCETDQESLSPPPSNVSLTTLNLDHSTISGVNILEDKFNEQNLRTSSPIISKTVIQAHQDNSCTSFHSKSIVSRTCSSEVTHVNIHESGVTLNNTRSYLKLKQHENIDTEERSYEVKPKKIKLLPRRLFSSTDKKETKVSGSVSTVSGNDLSTMDNDAWDGSDSNVGMMCQKISKEFTRKIQDRSRKMDCFTKQSLKSAQKHLTSMDVQVKECRIMHLEKFQQTVLEEIENFEKDSQTLKQMEKEFTNFWNKQTQTLSFYHKNEQRRIHSLKASFEKNVSHSTDYEDKIYNSEMHNMKENMKTVQERLLKEMQEEELLSVRRGLRSLFMTGAGPF
ncbi:synaptonemal complex protein 2 isoform X3 [Pseudophryne corroboree]|uniref:synaptonemal complex protein 2 isoform X3 n=1 Tax=Pseudophryne corroboree TaxID=495146 RepID=UPI00308149D9